MDSGHGTEVGIPLSNHSRDPRVRDISLDNKCAQQTHCSKYVSVAFIKMENHEETQEPQQGQFVFITLVSCLCAVGVLLTGVLEWATLRETAGAAAIVFLVLAIVSTTIIGTAGIDREDVDYLDSLAALFMLATVVGHGTLSAWWVPLSLAGIELLGSGVYRSLSQKVDVAFVVGASVLDSVSHSISYVAIAGFNFELTGWFLCFALVGALAAKTLGRLGHKFRDIISDMVLWYVSGGSAQELLLLLLVTDFAAVIGDILVKWCLRPQEDYFPSSEIV